ncbi:hypothetical protein ACU686_06890 [Yinghuangia aomiensis]
MPFASYRDESGLALPRLLVAVDDIDGVARRFPGFVKGLAEIVHRGGGLGMHLAVTTGQPALGLEVTAEPELRIALRVDDGASSHAVLHIDDAAALDAEFPGRALVRGSDGAVHPFQAGRVTSRMPRTATLRPTAVRQDWTDLGTPLNRRRAAAPGSAGDRRSAPRTWPCWSAPCSGPPTSSVPRRCRSCGDAQLRQRRRRAVGGSGDRHARCRVGGHQLADLGADLPPSTPLRPSRSAVITWSIRPRSAACGRGRGRW